MWRSIKNFYHLFVAILANIVFLFPSRGIKVIAVTGTDGKTTTVNLIYHILKTAGFKTSMISSIGAEVAGKHYETGFHVTTPSSFALQKFLRRAKNSGTKYFVLEVTSHAIDQNRIWGIGVEVGVLTNITSEHLDYHKTFDHYLKTKMNLLKKSKKAVVNSDDSSYIMLSEAKSRKDQLNWITYGLTDMSDYNPKNFDTKHVHLVGEFNEYNILASVAAANALSVDGKVIKEAVKNFQSPIGRVDFVYQKDFNVMIDFAHTPNAFEKLLQAIRPMVKGKIIHVFGSAGERDSIKRPFLGEISSQFCDILVLTAEDPRSEDVNKIIAEIEIGVKKDKCDVIRIPDRKEAIEAAIQMAKKSDLVLITGKSQEASMNYGKNEEPWNEYAVVKQALKTRNA